jgi:hypothetical protein
MTTYRCDDGDDTHASDIEANSAEEAAETWAEATHDNSAGEWTGGTCVVRELDAEGQIVGERRFEITVDWSPDFHVFPA